MLALLLLRSALAFVVARVQAAVQADTDAHLATVVFARARRGADPKDITADRREFGDLGRGGVRLQAALCALELLMPPSP